MKAIMTLRACAVQFCMALFAVMLCGCFSISVTHEIDGTTENNLLGGRYNIKDVDASLAAALRKHAPRSIVFVDYADPAAVPLNVRVSNTLEEKDATSATHAVLGLFTLFTFPGLMEEQRVHTINCVSPVGANEIGVRMIGRETVCWTPLGWLPFTFPIDGYDYTFGDLMDTWGEDKKHAWEDATVNATAKSIISTLTKARYDAYMKELAESSRKKKIAEEASRRENVLRMAEYRWPQEAMLRDFAVKETTGLWDIVVSFRAEISIRKNRLQRLSDAIKGFGRRPEEDADYIKCKGEYDTARSALVQIFKSLESTYLAASKNDALYDSTEARARTRKAVDECFQVAIETQQLILKSK